MKTSAKFSLTFLFIFPIMVYGQSFIMPLQDIPASQEIYVLTANNQTIYGKMRSSMWVSGQLKSFNMKSEDGEKLKFKAEEVLELGVRMNNWVRAQIQWEASSSIRKWKNTDLESTLNREWLVFERVLMPGNSNKYSLLQILNPGFDSKIKVYENPRAAKTGTTSVGGLAITGGEDRVHLVSIGGARSFVVRKGSYEKGFGEMFGSCPDLINEYSGEKVKFKDMAEQVWFFEGYCDAPQME